MTPKEKAIELFYKYCLELKTEGNEFGYYTNTIQAKKCALIAVDEVQRLIKDLSTCKNRFIYIIDEMNYWIEVKKEIKKL